MMIRVFIADDNAMVRDRLRAILEAYPEIVVVGDAADGCQALDQVLSLQPEVAILDFSLPELNGIRLTERILELIPEMRVILLSKMDSRKLVFQALQAGAQGFLLMESAGRDVVEAVLAVYAGKVYLSKPITKVLVSDYLEQRGGTQSKGAS
jgi:DNA-binding NarL/FixJ family response regulator